MPGYSKRARCWCMLGAIRTANIRIGLVTLYQNAAGDLYPRELTPFASSVFERATWAAARAILGRDPKPHAHTVTIITQWNDTTAVCGETVAQRLRDGAAIIRLRIEKVQRSIRAKSNMTPREWERLRDFREHREGLVMEKLKTVGAWALAIVLANLFSLIGVTPWAIG